MIHKINQIFAGLVNSINRVLCQRIYRMLYFSSDWNPELEQKYVWLAEQQKVDGIVHQVRNTLRQMGLSVPQDVQMIGFDGIRHLGDLELTCSTIVQPVDAIAETCVDLVLGERRGQTPSLICLPVHYEAGGTTIEKLS